MKTIPTTVDSKTLAHLADQTDTHAVRLILRQVHNFSPYRMQGKRYKYIFTHDSRIGAHVMDVPLSLWQGDVPKGAYRDNLSICHDLQGVRTTLPPLVSIIIPLKEGVAEFERQAQQADPMPAMLETLTGFLRDMDAPDEIMQAMAILTMPGVDADARKRALASHIAGVRGAIGGGEELQPQEPVITDIDPPEEVPPVATPPATAKQSAEEKKRKAVERAKKSRARKKQLESALV